MCISEQMCMYKALLCIMNGRYILLVQRLTNTMALEPRPSLGQKPSLTLTVSWLTKDEAAFAVSNASHKSLGASRCVSRTNAIHKVTHRHVVHLQANVMPNAHYHSSLLHRLEDWGVIFLNTLLNTTSPICRNTLYNHFITEGLFVISMIVTGWQRWQCCYLME